ncbi:MAG: tetratricopeptide repeat protein [Acidobacteriota bacterium]|nr:tetratricopeptide repeat protein [Acidobacteriota bacterium]
MIALTLLAATASCQQQSWEQYMEAASFAAGDDQLGEAKEWFLSAERLARGFDSTDPRLAVTLGNLADLYHGEGRDSEAEPLYLEALSLLERVDGPESARVGRFVADLAVFYTVLGRSEEAEPLYHRALTALELEYGPYHDDVLVLRTALAGFYLEQARFREADPLYREVLALLWDTPEPDHDRLLTVLDEYGLVLRALGRTEEAEVILDEARAIRAQF